MVGGVVGTKGDVIYSIGSIGSMDIEESCRARRQSNMLKVERHLKISSIYFSFLSPKKLKPSEHTFKPSISRNTLKHTHPNDLNPNTTSRRHQGSNSESKCQNDKFPDTVQ